MSQQYDEAPAETEEVTGQAVDPSPDDTDTGDAPIDVAPEETLGEPVTEPTDLSEDPATGEATARPLPSRASTSPPSTRSRSSASRCAPSPATGSWSTPTPAWRTG